MILLQFLPFTHPQMVKKQPFTIRAMGLTFILIALLTLLTGCTALVSQLTTSATTEPESGSVVIAEQRDESPMLPTYTATTTVSDTTESTVSQVEPQATQVVEQLQPSEPEPTPVVIPTDTLVPTAEPTLTPTSVPRTIAIIEAKLLNVRSSPNSGAQVLGQAPLGDQFNVLATSSDGQWVQICCPVNNAEGWVSADFVTIDSQSTPSTDAVASAEATQTESTAQEANNDTATTASGTVSGNLVNLRSGPGTQYPTVGQAKLGSTYELVERNEEGSWWRICCPLGEGTASWISDQLLDTQFSVGTDATTIPVAELPAEPEPSAVAQNDGQQAAALAAPAPGLPGVGGFGGQGNTNPLTGLPMPAGRENQRPLVVCINNDFAARPQFGTSQADVMYEYMMEGNFITRFSAVFYGEEPGHIGPVRSARLINYYLGALYNAGLACTGASDQVRYTLKHEAPFPYLDTDLDDPSNTRYSDSIGTDYRTRMRTDSAKLRRWLADLGAEQPAGIRGFTFGGTPAGGTPATNIRIPYPTGAGSQSSYSYDPGSGRYLRFLGGAAHTDGNTGAQLAPENVIVQYVPHEITDIVEDSLGSLSIRLNLFGSGRAILFRDGLAFEGTWRSDNRGDMPRFFAQDGSEIPLKPGKTWISVVDLNYAISY